MTRMIDVLVRNRIDVAATPLKEQGHSSFVQILFDDFRGKPGHVGRVGSAGNALNRMTGEVVDDRQRLAILRAAIGPVQRRMPISGSTGPTSATSSSGGREYA